MHRTAWLLAAVLMAGAALAQDPPPPEAQAPAAPEAAGEDIPFLDELPAAEAPQESAAAGPAGEEEEETLPPLPPGQRSTGPTPQRFDPTEEVRADFPVSFPVDI